MYNTLRVKQGNQLKTLKEINYSFFSSMFV